MEKDPNQELILVDRKDFVLLLDLAILVGPEAARWSDKLKQKYFFTPKENKNG